jgi:hypothetical protein
MPFRHVREGFRTAPLVDQRDQVLDLLGHAVEVGHLVVHADEAAFGAGAVVAGDVDEQRVVEFADLLERFLEATDLVVGVLEEPREHLGLAGEQTALVGRQRVPGLEVLGPLTEARVRGDEAKLLLALDRFGAHGVPALVELALVLVGPLLRHVVRCVDRAGRVIDEEWLVRCHRLLGLDPVDRLVGHVDREVIVLHLRRLDLDDAVVDERVPLVGLAADEAVELVEALVRGPTVERPRDAGFPGCGLVPFAEGAGAVAVQPQHFRQRRNAVRNLLGVAGVRRRGLHDRTGVHSVVVAAGLQRHARRRAQRRRMEVVAAQTPGRELVEGRRADRSAERARAAEADVVDQHDDDVRGALGRLDLEPRRWLDVTRVKFAVGRPFGLGDRQHRAIELLLRRSCGGSDGQRKAKNCTDCNSLHVFPPLATNRITAHVSWFGSSGSCSAAWLVASACVFFNSTLSWVHGGKSARLT